MTLNGNDSNEREVTEGIPHKFRYRHYYGDQTRILFVAWAIVLIVAKSTGADIPLTTMGAVATSVLLVIAAGITNPEQGWIHWVNGLIAIWGTILFGTTAIENYRAGVSLLDTSFVYIEALALISLIALYFTTRTVRGFHLRPRLS